MESHKKYEMTKAGQEKKKHEHITQAFKSPNRKERRPLMKPFI